MKNKLSFEYTPFSEMEYIPVDETRKDETREDETREAETRKDKKVKDHLDNEYNSFAEMERAYGFSRSTLQSRLRQGWSLEEALTKPVRNKK